MTDSGPCYPSAVHLRSLRFLPAFSFSIPVDYLQSNCFYRSSPSTLACHLGCRRLSDCRTCGTCIEANGSAQPKSPACCDLGATTYVGSKFFLSSSDLKFISVGNKSIMFLPSSIIGVRQNAQLTLQGSLCLHVFSELSYQPRS